MNPEDLKLKKDLEEIRSSYTRAKRLLKNLEVFSVDEFTTQFNEWRETLEDWETWVEATIEKLVESKERITGFSNEASGLVEKLKQNLNSVNSDINEMQASYENFLWVKWRLEEVNGNISNLSENAKQLKGDIEKTKTQSEATFENINKLFEKAQWQISNMQEAYQSFLEIKSKVEDEKTGLSAIFTKANSTYTKSLDLYKEIQSYRDESTKLLNDIKESKKNTDKISGEMNTMYQKSKTTTSEEIEKIKKITSLITDTWFANAFHKQAKTLMFVRLFWWIITILSILMLFIFIVKYIMPIWNGVPGIWELLYKATITSPLVFLIAFSAKQYSSETTKSDKYEFKAVTASSISHHTEFLKKEFPKNSDEVLSFATETFSKIYREPYDNSNNHDKRIKKLENWIKGSKATEKTDIKLSDITTSAKELREIFPDQPIEMINRQIAWNIN